MAEYGYGMLVIGSEPVGQRAAEEGGEKRGEDGDIESANIKPIWMWYLS